MSTAGTAGLSDVIKASFNSVFSELNLATEAWWQATKLDGRGRDRYADYIANSVGMFSLFAANRSVPVDSSFVRVGLTSAPERTQYKPLEDVVATLRTHRVQTERQVARDGYTLEEAVERGSGVGIAIVGAAGTGKTTLLRNLAVQAAKGRKLRGRRWIPAYLAVRDLSGEIALEAEVAASFARFGIEACDVLTEKLLESGRLLLILDGLDETTPDQQRVFVRQLRRLSTSYPQALFCVSSRPLTLDVELPGFDHVETLPLATEDRLIFIRKWFEKVDPEKGRLLQEAAFANPDLLNLGANPLLLSILCALYYNDLDIPRDTDELYERAVHGLLGQWDVFRNIARHTPLRGMSVHPKHEERRLT